MLNSFLLSQIETERETLRQKGEDLSQKKDHYLLSSIDIPETLDLDFLKLMLATIELHEKYKANFTLQQRRTNLGNLAISARLLTQRIKQPYDANDPNYAGYNIWRDLSFLIKFNLGIHLKSAAPIYTMPDDDATVLMDAVCTHFKPIIQAEIAAREIGDPPSIASQTLLRTYYKIPSNLITLYTTVTQKRENEQLDKALDAIEKIQRAVTPPQTINDTSKKMILMSLIVIGEASTKKNLTPQTVTFVHKEFVANGLRQTLINLANKITHNEWDIYNKNTEQCLNTFNFLAMQPDIITLHTIFLKMKNDLSNVNFLNHYSVAPAALATPPDPTLPTLVNLGTQLSTNHQNQERMHHPESFTDLALYDRIDKEIQSINNIVNTLKGKHCLTDDSLFNTETQIRIPGLYELLHTPGLINVNLQPLIVAAWGHITSHATRIGEDPAVEIPKELCPVEIANIGIHSQRTVSAQEAIQYCQAHYAEFLKALFQQGGRSQFYNSLLQDERSTGAISFHMGRIVKFMQEMDQAQLNQCIQELKANECTSFRNFIRHGNDAEDVYSVKPHMFLTRYVALIKRLPEFLAPLALHGPRLNL